ncbi:unnamed protein product [Mucor hiemalis]
MSDPKIHLLPFSVDCEGPINTKSYLKLEKENDQYETVIMGRKLVGTAVSLKDSSAQGHIWEKDVLDSYEDEDMDEDNVETMPWTKTNTEVEEFILWKKDNAPDAKDPRISAIHNWIDISQVIHTSIPLPSPSS